MARARRAAGPRAGAFSGGSLTRIVSGVWGGRRLVVPPDRRVRPTAERVREAWLNILTPELSGARILDLFAGSGALGLEALSRGAAHVTFVESHADSLAALRSNVAALGAEPNTEIHRGDAVRYVAGLAAGCFDVAVADPPFATHLAGQIAAAWQAVPFADVLAVEHARRTELSGGTTRRWGDIAVTFYRTP
jgi:16S rRNA (guanine966-N2)-methyltransferase